MSEENKRKPNKWLIRIGMAFVGIGGPTAIYLSPTPPSNGMLNRAPAVKLTPDEIRQEFAGLQIAMQQAVEKRIVLDGETKDVGAAQREYENVLYSMAGHVGKLSVQGRDQLVRLYSQLEGDAVRNPSEEEKSFKAVLGVFERILGDYRITPQTENRGR